ncbi:replication initiator protein A [Tateyamaria sp. syn59]|uniref:replication initiator protein A n=1 Tax=Tateyamaria sp. syn59 TaxID=2576942 RepID=UPI0011BF062B|nr:replication initiator protein A [Tateyamaria sp. syn59]
MSDKQVDLFLDQLADAPVKDERALMEFPFFSLQKRPRMTPFIFDDGVVKIEIQPGHKGIATIWDKDILIYLTSLVNERIENGRFDADATSTIQDRTITFSAYDFLKVTGRSSGKRAYELFLDALDRLRSTNILTNITAGDERERRGFGWIEDWRVIERTNRRGQKVMGAVEVTMNRWMFNAIVKDRRVLTINRDYFRLSKGLERRLYELARKHVGRQPEWYIGIKRLAEKCGSIDTERKFKFRINEICEAGTIPDYHVQIVDPASVSTPFKPKGKQALVRFQPKFDDQGVPDVPTTLNLDVAHSVLTDIKHANPEYDIQYILNAWQDWAMTRDEPVKNPNAAFRAFAKKYIEANPIW